ncbi:MAG: hypothetical protein KIT22_07725 [Verrucomicrobiae bacterium]|nr:hypothetical protein [Verrucomicrobiae bacterium]
MTVELERRDAGTGGAVAVIDRFPWSVGRAGADLDASAPGVWDRHFTLVQTGDHAFAVSPESEAPLSVNGMPVSATTVLRNGDRIGCGAIEFQFRLAPTRSKSLAVREWVTWAFLTGWLLLQGILALAWPR